MSSNEMLGIATTGSSPTDAGGHASSRVAPNDRMEDFFFSLAASRHSFHESL